MKSFPSLALVFTLIVPALSALPPQAPELTDAGLPAARSARDAAAAHSSARPLFAVTHEDKKAFITIHAGQLDTPFLLTATITTGLGGDIRSGDYEGNFLVSFRRVGDTIQFFRLNTEFRAAPGSPEAEGVKARYPDSPLASVKITTENAAAGFVVVPAEELFLADPTNVQATVAGNFGNAALSLNKTMTRLDGIEALHSNLDVDMTFVFEPQTPVRATGIPDARRLPVTVRYSLSALPGKGFKTRESDPRIGYFTAKHRDYSASDLKDKMDPVRELITRWRLEKVDPSADVSDVKKQIVWWLDAAMPKKFRGAVRAGILAWNEAFEAVGLRNVLVVKEVDQDMSPEERAHFNPSDAAYNVVRWFLDPKSGTSYGPSRVNPLTGEIYSATVMMSDIMSRLWDVAFKPDLASAIDKDVRPDPAKLAALLARGLSPAEKERVIQDYLTAVVAHEIGHTLGLRHNFKGSALLAPKDLGRNGLLASSVMDYTPMNIPAPGSLLKVYSQTVIGPYDRKAIEYGYSAQSDDDATRLSALKKIARSAPPYATDEDVTGVAPDAQRWLLGNETVRSAGLEIDRAETLWNRAAAAAAPEITPPPDIALGHGLGMYRHAVSSVLPLIGGVRSDRRPIDEGGTRLKPVPAAEQLAALDFLNRRVFAAEAFAVPAELVLRAAPDPVEAAGGHGLPNVPEKTLAIQRMALDHLYNPETLKRLSLAEQYQPKTALTTAKLSAVVNQAVWSELQGKGPVAVGPLRRQLQRAHIEALTLLAKNPVAPLDAISLARQDLAAIAQSVKAAQKRAADPRLKAHLDEMFRLANKRNF